MRRTADKIREDATLLPLLGRSGWSHDVPRPSSVSPTQPVLAVSYSRVEGDHVQISVMLREAVIVVT